MVTKKGSKAYRAKMSKLQKASWKKRKALVAEPVQYEEVAVKLPPTKEQLETAASYTIHDEIEAKALIDWINKSGTPGERAKRKTAMMGILYGSSADSLSHSIDKMSTELNQSFNPDAMFVKPPIHHDPVNHPAHYLRHPSGVECITIAEQFNFNRGNAIKYIWRADEKGSTLENLRKAQWYLNREIERLEKEATR